jgi:hypothetical protein
MSGVGAPRRAEGRRRSVAGAPGTVIGVSMAVFFALEAVVGGAMGGSGAPRAFGGGLLRFFFGSSALDGTSGRRGHSLVSMIRFAPDGWRCALWSAQPARRWRSIQATG